MNLIYQIQWGINMSSPSFKQLEIIKHLIAGVPQRTKVESLEIEKNGIVIQISLNGHKFRIADFDGFLTHDDIPMVSINEKAKQVEKWLEKFKTLATTRGIGWAMLYYDSTTKQLLNAWIDEHHIGQLNGCKTIIALDMWEHAFVADYLPSGKKDYINDFFENLNWSKIEENFINSK